MNTHRFQPGSVSPSPNPSASPSTSRPERPGRSRAQAGPAGLSRRSAQRQEPGHEGRNPGSRGPANRSRGQESSPTFPKNRLEQVRRECLALPHDILSEPPVSIECLSAEQRTLLEPILTCRFTAGSSGQDAANLPELPDAARQAMRMWLMVQSARLQSFSRDVRLANWDEFHWQLAATGIRMDDRMVAEDSRVRHAERAACAHVRGAHDAQTRPEYATALNNFLRYLDPSLSLHPTLRSQVVVAFNHQREMGRISPQVVALVDALGLETLAREGYRLNPASGNFKSEAQRAAEQQGGGFMRPPGRAAMPSFSGAGSSRLAEPRPEPAPAQAGPRLTPQGELWMNHILGLSSKPRSRIGKLPDSEQYQHIRSMPSSERALLEPGLEALFMEQGPSPVSPVAERALEAWLTAQQVRLRIHSEASLKHHEQATRPLGAKVKLVVDRLTGTSAQNENARFHSEHLAANRPEYALAINNFLRLLHPSTLIAPALRDRIAERFIHHAEKEGTISAPVIEVMKHVGGPRNMAVQGWRLDPQTDAFSAPPLRTGLLEGTNLLAVPTTLSRRPPGESHPGHAPVRY